MPTPGVSRKGIKWPGCPSGCT